MNQFKKQRRLHPRYPHAYYALLKKDLAKALFFDEFKKGDLITYVVADDLRHAGKFNVLIMDREQKKCNCIGFTEMEEILNRCMADEPYMQPVEYGGMRLLDTFSKTYQKAIAQGLKKLNEENQ